MESLIKLKCKSKCQNLHTDCFDCSSKGNKNVPHTLELLLFMRLLQCRLIRETFR